MEQENNRRYEETEINEVALDGTINLNQEEKQILDKLLKHYERDKPPPNIFFKYVDKKKMKEAVGKINKVAKKVTTNNITDTNRLLRAITWCTADILDLKERGKSKTKEE